MQPHHSSARRCRADDDCNAPFQYPSELPTKTMIWILSTLLFLTPIIDEAIPQGPFIYPGSRPREVIVVDPEKSPLLDQAYRDLEQRLSEKFSEEQILETVFLYVRDELFDLRLCKERLVQQFIYSLYPDEAEPEIPLETFLEYKIGVCRHTALATTCLVDRLVKEGWLQGKALLIRSNCPAGRHAWTLFLSEEGAWHLDSLWGIFENGKTGAGLSQLCDNYGKRIMNEQKKRWETSP